MVPSQLNSRLGFINPGLTLYSWLVVWNMNFIFPNSYFSEGEVYHQPDMDGDTYIYMDIPLYRGYISDILSI
jgi:hypothetical protein